MGKPFKIARIRDDAHIAIDFILDKDGSSMLRRTEHYLGGEQFYFHLNKEATNKLYAELFIAFGVPFTVPDDPKEP